MEEREGEREREKERKNVTGREGRRKGWSKGDKLLDIREKSKRVQILR